MQEERQRGAAAKLLVPLLAPWHHLASSVWPNYPSAFLIFLICIPFSFSFLPYYFIASVMLCQFTIKCATFVRWGYFFFFPIRDGPFLTEGTFSLVLTHNLIFQCTGGRCHFKGLENRKSNVTFPSFLGNTFSFFWSPSSLILL